MKKNYAMQYKKYKNQAEMNHSPPPPSQNSHYYYYYNAAADILVPLLTIKETAVDQGRRKDWTDRP